MIRPSESRSSACLAKAGIRRSFPVGPTYSCVEDIWTDIGAYETVVPVVGARVVVAHYDLILHDFAYVFDDAFRAAHRHMSCSACASTDALCHRAIDHWLIGSAAYVSEQQAKANLVNSTIARGTPSVTAFRPPRYGRAIVMSPAGAAGRVGAGLLDIKGAGVGPGITPTHASHSNGLEYLAVAIADYLYSWLVDRVFEHSVPGYCSVPTYAVIDLGFDVADGWLGTAPAGLHVRRAHRRGDPFCEFPMSGSPDEFVKIQMELILRKFGLTTTTPLGSFEMRRDGDEDRVYYYKKPINARTAAERLRLLELKEIIGTGRLESVNIQLANEVSWDEKRAQIVDFGHVKAWNRFYNPIAFPARDSIFQMGRVIRVDDNQFVQPDPEIALDGDLFGRHALHAFGLYAAHSFRSGNLQSREIKTMMSKIIARSGI